MASVEARKIDGFNKVRSPASNEELIADFIPAHEVRQAGENDLLVAALQQAEPEFPDLLKEFVVPTLQLHHRDLGQYCSSGLCRI